MYLVHWKCIYCEKVYIGIKPPKFRACTTAFNRTHIWRVFKVTDLANGDPV